MSCSDWLILGWILDSSMGQAVGTVKPRSYRACLEHSRNDKEVRVVGGKWIRGWVAENEVPQWQGSDRVGSYLKEMGSSCKILRRLAWSALYFKRIPLAVVIEADCRGAKVNTDLLRGWCHYPAEAVEAVRSDQILNIVRTQSQQNFQKDWIYTQNKNKKGR